MKPIKTDTTNAVYTLEGCNDLPVTKYIDIDYDDNMKSGVESCWELEAEDIENIKKNGGKIYLYIQGSIVPPVLLTTESMVFFKEGEE